MKRSWNELGPSLLVAAGILLSAFIAVHTESRGWTFLIAPLVMTVAIAAGALLDSRVRARSSRRQWLSLLVACSMLLVASALTSGRGRSSSVFLPSMGAAVWASMLAGSRRRRICNDAV